MRRADRLLQIVQILRRSDGPTTALALAKELEVVPRTIYRDIVALQASRVPIDGEAGVGYLLRPGYDLPPLMFGGSEIEAVVLGLAMVVERGDDELAIGARDALAKIKAVIPAGVTSSIDKARLLVPHTRDAGLSFGDQLATIRRAVRESRKVSIVYEDANEKRTRRTIWPLGLYLYSHVTIVCAWCEKRRSFRAFRSERIANCRLSEQHFDARNGLLMAEFLAHFRDGQRQARQEQERRDEPYRSGTRL